MLDSYVQDDPSIDQFRVRREAYTSNAVMEAEEEKIFQNSWLYVAHESEIPKNNDFVTRVVARRPLIVSRDERGRVNVLINSCRHRGAEVCREDRGNARIFRCFYHAWSYGSDGRLVNVPSRENYPEGMEFDDLGLKQPTAVAVYRGFVFAAFGSNVPPLVDYLGNAREYLDLVVDQSSIGMEVVSGTHKYAIDANWKLLVENSLDGYHLLPLHKSYFDFVADSGDVVRPDRETKAVDLGNGHALIVDRAPWGRPTARWAPSLGIEVKELVEQRRRDLVQRLGEERAAIVADTDRNLLIFPNLVINDIMAVTIRMIWPVTPGRMSVTGWAIAPIDDGELLRSASLRNFVSFLGPGGFATPDDIEALESVQRGLGSWREVQWSDMSRGIGLDTCGSDGEVQARAFWREWQRRISNGAAEAKSHSADQTRPESTNVN